MQSSVVLRQRFILSSILHSIAMNVARSLQSRPFSQLTLEEKLEVKRLGPDRPQLLAKSAGLPVGPKIPKILPIFLKILK